MNLDHFQPLVASNIKDLLNKVVKEWEAGKQFTAMEEVTCSPETRQAFYYLINQKLIVCKENFRTDNLLFSTSALVPTLKGIKYNFLEQL